jgi:hypothetical protein
MGKLHSARRCFPRRQRVLDHTLGIPYGQLIDRSFLAAIIRNWSTLATGARHFLDEATGYSFSDKEGLPTPTELSHERIGGFRRSLQQESFDQFDRFSEL